MFKPKDTQTTIFQTHLYLPDKLRNRLKESWAEIFRKDIMPIIPEKEVTNFETENANESDQNALMPIIEDLENQGLKPDILALDAGYVSDENILDAEEQDVVLLGRLTTGRSSDNDKLSLADFHMDIEDRIFECPQGAPAIFSSENEDGSIEVRFD